MIFDSPLPFAEALAAKAVKTLLPTELRTKDLALLEPALRQRALFSAGITSAELLQGASDGIDKLLAGTSDRATQRLELKKILGSLGAPVDETDLTDIRSDARLNLILDTNVQQAQGYGHKIQGEQADVLDQWPAKELIRIADAKEPRDWPAIWAAAGGTFFGGRMIDLKGSAIWKRINFFGVDYAPFQFGSHMQDEDVDRSTAVDAGLIGEDDPAPVPDREDFNADLQAAPAVREEWLRSALAESLQGTAAFDAAGVLRFTGKAAA